MRVLFTFICFFLFALPALAQDTQKEDQQEDKKSVEQKTNAKIDGIKLDDLYLDARIEKPSVTILPTRLEPELENIEYIIRNFDFELKMVSDEIFGFEYEKRKCTKVDNVKALLNKSRK